MIDAAATDLGISSANLTAALKKALIARVDAAVEAGTLTEAQATEMKARINSGEVPLVGLGGGRHHGGPGGPDGIGHFGELDAAATYLGMTQAELRTAQESGKTLAAIAKEKGKTVDGLVDAMVAAVTKDVNAAVTAGTLTDAQRDRILSDLEARITEHVNNLRPGARPARPRRPGGPPHATLRTRSCVQLRSARPTPAPARWGGPSLSSSVASWSSKARVEPITRA